VAILLVLFFAFSFLGSVSFDSAKADVGAIGEGSTNIVPVNNTQIELTKEDLVINLETGTVDALFYMKNTGDKTDQKMGFPFQKGIEYSWENFFVYVNNKQIPETDVHEGDSNSAMWKVFTVPFEKDEEKTVRVKYAVLLTYPSFTYFLTTGSTWKGSIGELNITITLPGEAKPPLLLKAIPSGYKTEGKNIVYHFENYEPKEDIIVEYLPPDFYKETEELRDKAYKTNKPEDWYNYLKKLLPIDIVGPYGRRNPHGYFVNAYKTDGYENFVRSELQRGIEACKDTEYGKILSVAYEAHFANKDAFLGGVSEIKDFGKIESLFGDELEHPKTKEMGRIVAYYYWWKANALGGNSPKYESFDALAKFIKLAEKYIPFDECKYLNNVEIVQYTPYYVDSPPVFEEFINPKKIVIKKDASNKIQSIRFDFQIIRGWGAEEYKETIMAYEAAKIAKEIPDITFDLHSDTPNIIPMTCTIPKGDLAPFEEEINKILQILGTEHSPIYVYPKMLLEKMKENPSISELDTKNLKENLVSKLENAKKEIEGNVTDYWKRMKDGGYSNNTYKGVMKLPVEFIEKNEMLLDKIPDKILVETVRANGAAENNTNTQPEHPANPANTANKMPFIWIWIILIAVIAILFAFFMGKRKRN